MSHSLEKQYQIWNDEDGSCLEVGPDRDGLSLLELRDRDEQGKIVHRFTLNWEQVPLLIKALQDLADDHKLQEDNHGV